ncbi:MAG TPA: MurR/RpiR family transcriptional regulator [Symbiobacteriaceae bacterium]|jgi:RpiR family transcriptional regulator, carbohydrate utilization regulator|nr:MurR/RpiR family transcriptional regulator [Symbiobacteriaceae bacterium]
MATNDGDLQVRLSTALEARISGIRHDLSDKEQAVASFLLSEPKEFVSLSISALAARCRVSETVIIRLYRKLGYDGFHQFKIDIAQSLTEASADALGDLKTGDDVETIKKKVFAITRQALEDSIGMVDSDQLAAARDALLSARRVVVAAFGGSASVGLDFVHKLLKLGIIASLQQDTHMQAMSAAVMGADDVLMAISHSGNSRDIVEVLEIARQQGATTILLTGFPRSPAAKAADINLYSVCRETKFQTDAMTSRIVQLAVLDTLMVSMIFADKERASASIHATSVAAARKKL